MANDESALLRLAEELAADARTYHRRLIAAHDLIAAVRALHTESGTGYARRCRCGAQGCPTAALLREPADAP